MKSLVIITSVINVSNNPLSYTNNRSVYSAEERFVQTLKTINSLSCIKDKHILFIETSNLEADKENVIKNIVDSYLNLNNIKEIKEIIDGPIKGKAEAIQIIEGLKQININEFDCIIKISGRYWINDDFSYDLYSKEINIFREDQAAKCVSTVLYKVKKDDFETYLRTLDFCKESDEMLESDFFKFFQGKYFTPNKIGVSGNVSVNGKYIEF
jgi:hypothetical protein